MINNFSAYSIFGISEVLKRLIAKNKKRGPRLVIETDQIYTDISVESAAEDRFQRYEFAKRVSRIALSNKSDKSTVIGLYGKWGEGKTSVLNFIRKELPEHDDVIRVDFNPWLYSDEHRLLLFFFKALEEKLNISTDTQEKIGKWLVKYAELVGETSEKPSMTLGLVKWIGSWMNKSASAERLKGKIDDYIKGLDKNIVVFIDDIDRLDISEIQYVFKLVKLVGDFPRTSYILSFDDQMVAAALSPKYAGDDKSAGYNFLEKIIQIPITIPKASEKQIRDFTIEKINEIRTQYRFKLEDYEFNEFVEIFDSSFLPVLENPRMSIRYVNSLSVIIPLLREEVNHIDLLILEGCKIFYPELYLFIRGNRNFFISLLSEADSKDRKENIKNQLDEIMSGYSERKKRCSKNVLTKLFPKVHVIYSSVSNAKAIETEEWTWQRRICSGKFFNRYFSYGIDASQISEVYFNGLINIAKIGDPNFTARITELLTEYGSFEFIQTLRAKEDDLSLDETKAFALAIVANASSFPLENDLPIATSFIQSIRMVTRFVNRIDREDQLDFSLDLLNKSQTFDYVIELGFSLITPESKREEELIFEDDEIEIIRDKVVNMFEEKIDDNNFFDLVPRGSLLRVLNLYAISNFDEDSKLRNLIKRNLGTPSFAIKILKAILSTITSYSTNGTSKTFFSKFSNRDFEMLKKIVDVNELERELTKQYGYSPYPIEDLEKEEDDKTMNDLSDEDIVYRLQSHILIDKTQKEN